MFATVMILALAVGPAHPLSISGRSCTKTTVDEPLIDETGARSPRIDEANRYFAAVATPLPSRETPEARGLAIAADAQTASMTLTTGACHDADDAPPPLPACAGDCDPATTSIFDRQYPDAWATFRSCGAGVDRQRDYRRKAGGDWLLVGARDSAVASCPPAATP